MRKIRVVLLATLIFLTFEKMVYGKYTYVFETQIADFSRDSNAPICNVKYSTEEVTNEKVTVTITSNKEIEQVSGFELSEDKKVLTRVLEENEEGVLTVRDLEGNFTEIEYHVENIDKNPPQILNCIDGGTYSAPLKLEYSDDSEIKEINIQKYTENLTVIAYEKYYDSYFYHGIDRTNTTLTVHVEGSPKDTKKYRYYINDKLYTTLPDMNYTFTGLKKATIYLVKVEAIDANGTILETAQMEAKTSYYDSITSSKNEEKFEAVFHGLEKEVRRVDYELWNCNNPSQVRSYETEVTEEKCAISCQKGNDLYYPAYTIEVNLYGENEEVLDTIEFLVDFGTNYEEKNIGNTENELTEKRKLSNKIEGYSRQ